MPTSVKHTHRGISKPPFAQLHAARAAGDMARAAVLSARRRIQPWIASWQIGARS